MISQLSSFVPQNAPRLASVATLSMPTRLDAFVATAAAAPPPS